MRSGDVVMLDNKTQAIFVGWLYGKPKSARVIIPNSNIDRVRAFRISKSK